MIYEPKGKAAEYAYLAINHYTGCVGGCDYPCYMADMFRKKKVQPPITSANLLVAEHLGLENPFLDIPVLHR